MPSASTVAAALSALLLGALPLSSSAKDFVLTEHLASKSPYRPLGDLSAQTPPPPTCTPLHVNLVARHGNRNPGEDDILEYQRLSKRIEELSPSLRYGWMRGFTSPVRVEDEGKLVEAGMYDRYYLAQRMAKAFPEVFGGEYDSDVFFMRATQEQRAMMSADAYAYGLFEGRGRVGPDRYEPHFIYADTEALDDVLKFYDNCELYVSTVGDNDTAIIEKDLYLATVLPGMAARFSTILTTDGSWEATEEDVLAFHSLCQTQASIYGVEDEFCTLFLQQELEQLEYWEDLDDYYSKAYPYPVNYEMAIPLIKDLASSMVAASQGLTPQRANLRFAHSSTVVPLVSVFGLNKDNVTLRSDSPQSVIDSRKFRTSDVSPMGSNFMLVLYQCGGEHRVKVLLNEMEVVVQGCDELYCPLETFLKAYAPYLEGDFDAYCGN